MRHYSYRMRPILPCGNDTYFDNVQLAFNVVPEEDKPWGLTPPGTMPRYTAYYSTDYEYALNTVAPEYGGGFEIWRSLCPGMPLKHFYPRQPPSPFDGPVKAGKLITVHTGNTRITECAIPWQEIPLVKQALDEGRTIKFGFAVNDNDSKHCLQPAKNRSVSDRLGRAFAASWRQHWATELEFAFEHGE